jgi:hypothetical protein
MNKTTKLLNQQRQQRIKTRLRHILYAHKQGKLSKFETWLFAVLISNVGSDGVSSIDIRLLDFSKAKVRKALKSLIANDYITLVMARGRPSMFSFVNRIEVESFDGGMMMTAYCNPGPICVHPD